MTVEPRTARSRIWPAIVEGWIAVSLAAFILLRIAGSAMAQRIAHTLFSR